MPGINVVRIVYRQWPEIAQNRDRPFTANLHGSFGEGLAFATPS